jgi:multiple antibiotic resistance protein
MFGTDQINFSEIFTLTLALFAVIDILGAVPVLLSLRKKIGGINAMHATLVSGALMLIFFYAGEQVLIYMGLDIHSFAIAGSIVIFIVGLEMVLGVEFFRTDKDVKSGNLVPIAFPLIAGSGTLTTVMSLKSNYHEVNILLAIFINLIFVYITLCALDLIERVLGPSGILAVRKFFGVILLAIAVKMFRANLGV